jgi:hypothetical protein
MYIYKFHAKSSQTQLHLLQKKILFLQNFATCFGQLRPHSKILQQHVKEAFTS